MTNSWLNLVFNSARLALEAQQVMMLRGMRIAGGGASGDREIARMVSEKVVAFAEAGVAATAALALGRDPAAVAGGVVRRYRSKVRRNARRLSRRA